MLTMADGLMRPRAEVMRCLIEALGKHSDGLSSAEMAAEAADAFDLTPEELASERTYQRPSGRTGSYNKWRHEVRWACQELKRQGLADRVSRDLWALTDLTWAMLEAAASATGGDSLSAE